MASIIVMPQMGYDMREGRIVKWLKSEGDAVERGDEVAEIETDKAVVPMRATASGVLRRILAQEGAMVPVGEAIGIVAAAGEALPEELPRADGAASAETAGPDGVDGTPSDPDPAREPDSGAVGGRVAASPLARRIARERGIDVTQVTGTGPGGRIIERDVLGYAAAREAGAAPTAAEASGGVERVELSRMRQAIARVTSRSMQEAPHFYVTSEVNMGETEHLRRELNSALEQRKTRVSVNDFIIKACALALAVHPTVNATFQGDGLALHTSVNMGIAIDLEGRGLIIPTLFGCERRSLEEVAEGSRDLVERAKSDGLRPEELSGSTFTVSNLGSLDVESFSAIIYQPNSAVLAVGAIKERPVVEQGQIVAARMMKMTLSVDHRVTDGAGAARFLREVKRRLEHPVGMLV